VLLREEIRSRLWPDDTIVEFEHSINAAVKRLRDTLCDSAGKPRYIETMARRGYRFIGEKPRPVAGCDADSFHCRAAFADLSSDREKEYFSGWPGRRRSTT
jgi:hypothetical protein